ncbi:MAG: electron transport complex subunit RsxC [Marinobacter sp.]
MTQLWNFGGGVHPPENKSQSNNRPIRPADLPAKLILPLQQHIGEPARCIVAPGQKVLKGEVIAQVDNGMGVPVHAPTSGIIERISLEPVPHPSGMSDTCVVLIPDGEERWCALVPQPEYRKLGRDQVLVLIRQAGIVGLGGAGFPTNIKLRPSVDRKVDTLILNGAECEPYITADDMTMREKAAQVMAGLRVMAWLLRPARVVIGIEENKPEAIAALRQAAEGSKTEIAVIPTIYPSGGEKQLIQILTGQEVPSGGIPADIGVMCQNIGTAVAVADAILQGKPLISRVITATGEALAEPGNFEVLVGTPTSHLLTCAGVDKQRMSRLVLGGPMMGYTVQDLNIPLVKASNCILAPTEQELPTPPPAQACIRCGMCAEACPMELLPQQLFWHAKATEFEKAEHLNLFDCIECGVCSYVCPSSIPLVQYYRFAKGEIRLQRAEQQKSDRARVRFEARQQRLDREQQEKDQRRKDRALAAAKAQEQKTAEAQTMVQNGTVSDERAGKSALVAQALARKKAKTTAASADTAPAETFAPENTGKTPAAETAPNIEELEQQLTQAQAKLEKMQSMLEDAHSGQAPNVDKLERAVDKNIERVRCSQQAIDDLQKQAVPANRNAEPALSRSND